MLLVLLLAALLQACAGLRERSLLIRDFPGGVTQPPFCNNTVGGRWYIADDQGIVCRRDELDYSTGCCTGGAQHSCETCEDADHCCSGYEHCVSCCMGPRFAFERKLKDIPRGLNKPETGFWSTPFEYCRALCRTSSRSTQHENAFILDRRYCFSRRGRPLEPFPPLPPLPDNVAALVGKPGESCTDACASAGKVCSAAHIASVNDCNVLRDLFPCEAGCSRAGQQHFPGYVSSGAPKWSWPALCLSFDSPAAAADHKEFNCTASFNHVQRVCTCEEMTGQAVVQGDGAAAGGGTAQGVGAATGGEAAQGVGAAGELAAGGAMMGQATDSQQGQQQQVQSTLPGVGAHGREEKR